MEENSRFLGKFFSKTHQRKIEVNVDIIEYQEDDIYYAYSPALDLVGYGNNEVARNSWEVVLQEYFKYTLNKKTLIQDFESRGWNIKQNNHRYTPPKLSWLLQNNEGLTDMYDKHNFQKISRSIQLPLQESCV